MAALRDFVTTELTFYLMFKVCLTSAWHIHSSHINYFVMQ